MKASCLRPYHRWSRSVKSSATPLTLTIDDQTNSETAHKRLHATNTMSPKHHRHTQLRGMRCGLAMGQAQENVTRTQKSAR